VPSNERGLALARAGYPWKKAPPGVAHGPREHVRAVSGALHLGGRARLGEERPRVPGSQRPPVAPCDLELAVAPSGVAPRAPPVAFWTPWTSPVGVSPRYFPASPIDSRQIPCNPINAHHMPVSPREPGGVQGSLRKGSLRKGSLRKGSLRSWVAEKLGRA
jgi:hypothetical protein